MLKNSVAVDASSSGSKRASSIEKFGPGWATRISLVLAITLFVAVIACSSDLAEDPTPTPSDKPTVERTAIPGNTTHDPTPASEAGAADSSTPTPDPGDSPTPDPTASSTKLDKAEPAPEPVPAVVQAGWSTLLPGISDGDPLIGVIGKVGQKLSKFDGLATVAVVRSDGGMYVTSATAPDDWSDWKQLGDQEFARRDAAVFVNAGDRLHLVARGTDGAVYQASRTVKAGWTDWTRIVPVGKADGRISATATDDGEVNFHVLHSEAGRTADSPITVYRLFNKDWQLVDNPRRWAGGIEATIGSDGDNPGAGMSATSEVLAVIRSDTDTMVAAHSQKSTNGDWGSFSPVEYVKDGQGQSFLDISNVEMLGDEFHWAYATAFTDVGPGGLVELHHLRHARILVGAGSSVVRTQFVSRFDSRLGTYPLASVEVYRNKLTAAFLTERGGIDWYFLDSANADGDLRQGGRWVSVGTSEDAFSSRPSIASIQKCIDPRSPECQRPNFGNDVLSVGSSKEGAVSFVNLSRSYMTQRLAEARIGIDWCTGYVQPPGGHKMVKCPDVDTVPITELPITTEVGFAMMVIPDWLVRNAFERTMRNAGLDTFYTAWIHTQFIGAAYVGPNTNLDAAMNYVPALEELGHSIASSLGLCDRSDSCKGPATNLLSEFIADEEIAVAFDLFGEKTGSAAACLADLAGRCRGFTGWSGNYDVGTRQHSFLYGMLAYTARGEDMRVWIADDLRAGNDLLYRKYAWLRENIFAGAEFDNGHMPRHRLSSVLLINVNSTKCLDVAARSKDDGANVQQWGCHSGDNQRWELRSSTDGQYLIVNQGSGRCLDVADGSLDYGANIEQFGCNGGESQRWSLEPADDHSLMVVNISSGACLDIAARDSKNGANLQQWGCHGGTNQRWIVL